MLTRHPACAASPQPVKRTVWERDGGQCTFVSHRQALPERDRLEFHHDEPFALGGDRSPDNIRFCAATTTPTWPSWTTAKT